MSLCAFIGDEVSAAGFRLAGVDVWVPTRGEAPGLFRRLLDEVQIVLITAEAAAWVPHDELGRALAAGRPLVLVIPDARGRGELPDITRSLKRQLGMAE